MNTYSEYVQITSDKLLIKIPEGFYKGKALLTITPMPENDIKSVFDKDKKVNFKKLLLKKPFTLTDDEVLEFSNIRKWMNEWNPESY